MGCIHRGWGWRRARTVFISRGVPIREDVRAPLRGLTDAERDELLVALLA